jgi:hypothetical protein
MKIVSTLLAFASLLLAIGCTTEGDRHEEPMRGAAVATYHTFAIAPMPTSAPASDPAATARLAGTAHQELVRSLTAKGYTEAPADQADFLVKVVGEFLPDPLVETSERRILTINLIDRASGNEIWSDYRSRSGTQTMSPEQLRTTIAGMLAPLPNRAP